VTPRTDHEAAAKLANEAGRAIRAGELTAAAEYLDAAERISSAERWADRRAELAEAESEAAL
jgi:hypothetical protein